MKTKPITNKMLMDAIEEHIAAAIKVNVNGKIDSLRLDFNNYVKEDTAWKEENQPSLDNMRNITGVGKFVLGLIVSLGAAAAGWSALISFIQRK